MPSSLHYAIDQERHCAVVTYEQQPDFAEWKLVMDAIFADSRFHPSFGILLDRSRISVAPSTAYVGQQVRYIDARNERFARLRWAVVAPDVASFGVGRMSEKMVRPNSMRTFHSLQEAMEWLAT